MLRELLGRYPFADRRSHPLLEVLATGRARLVEHPNGPTSPTRTSATAELVAQFTIKSTVLVPLSARERTLGVMALGFATVVGTDYLSLFEDLAAAAARHRQRRLYEQRAWSPARSSGAAAQRAPPRAGRRVRRPLPAAGPGAQRRRRRPLRRFPTPSDGRWALAVADVCGKGPQAAALTALIRHTVQAEGRHGFGPADVVRRVNAAMLRNQAGSRARFATMVHRA